VNDIASCFPELCSVIRKMPDDKLEVIARGSVAMLDKFETRLRRLDGWVVWVPPTAIVNPAARAQMVIETSQRDPVNHELESVRLVDLFGHRIARTPAELAGGENSSGGDAGASLHWEYNSTVDSSASISSSVFRQEMEARMAVQRERDEALRACDDERNAREAADTAREAAEQVAAEVLVEKAGFSMDDALKLVRTRAASRVSGAAAAAAGGAGDA
jgi:hypothetical protein